MATSRRGARRQSIKQKQPTSHTEKTLLDSVILIDHLNGIEAATTYLQRCQPTAFISAITRAEVLSGLATTSAVRVAQLLDSFAFIAIDKPIADLAAVQRREHRWKLPDALQVAAALTHGLMLATRNTKDFPPSKFDFVFVPYKLSTPRAVR